MRKYYDISQFKERVKSCNGIICIGLGRHFYRMLSVFENTDLSKKIIALGDNDKNKIDTKMEVFQNEIVIEPVPSAIKKAKHNTIIIITCADYSDLLIQIEKNDNVKDIDIICFSHLNRLYIDYLALCKTIPDNLYFTSKQIIPKKIHYCWFGKKPIPDKYKKWMNSWKKFCPDYQIIEWNEGNYDITKNKYMHQAYKAGKWGFVPDYARLDIIYNHGGIYLDTDVEIIKNLDHLLYQEAFAGFESAQYVALGLGFGSQKGNTIIKEMLDQYDNLDFINDQGEINLTASPVFQTSVLLSHGLKQTGEFQSIEGMNIYPEKMFCAKNMASRLIRTTPYTCSIHHYEASWQSDDFRLQSYLNEKEMNQYYGHLVSHIE